MFNPLQIGDILSDLGRAASPDHFSRTAMSAVNFICASGLTVFAAIHAAESGARLSRDVKELRTTLQRARDVRREKIVEEQQAA